MTPWQRALHRIAFISIAFCIIVLGALVANAIASRAADPNPPTHIDELVQRLNQDPKNEKLLAEIRREDEWLRSSFLRSQRFAATGFFLLLGGTTVLLLSLKGSKKLLPTSPLPNPNAPKRNALERLSAQQGTLTLGLALSAVLTLVATLSRHDAVAGYVADSRMPMAEGKAGEAPKIEEAPAVPMLSTTPAATTPPPLSGSIPAAVLEPVGGTALVPLPVEGPPPVEALASPPKKVNTSAPAVKAAVAFWPGFRGPGFNGVAEGSAPLEWDASSGKNVLWKSAVPLQGYGSPAIWGERLFLSGADAKTREVYAYSTSDGKPLWKTSIPLLKNSGPMEESSGTGFAPATVAVDAEHVVAVFVNGDVACLDHSGKLLWSLAFGKLDNPYGHASSPLLIDGKLILQVDQGHSPEDGLSSLVALDPKNGKSLWAVKRGVGVSWSTPMPVSVDGKPILVTYASNFAIAHDLATGKELWRADGLYGEVAPSPALGEGVVFAAQMSAGLFAFGAGDGKVLWMNSELSLPDISSPVYANGIVFLSGPDGTFAAVDAKDGKALWEQKFEKPARSSPIVVGDRIYLTDNEGITRVVNAGRQYKLLGTSKLGEKVGATPAIVGGRVYLRGEKHLFCLGVP